jgi:HAD superfamily hydrolase (TIGR01662 family)
MPEIAMIVGYPASGKSTLTEEYIARGFTSLNRDTEGGKIASLVPKMVELIKADKNVVLDNTFATILERKQFIDAAKENGADILCDWLTTSIEDAQFNACYRMMERKGKILTPAEIKADKSPNLFPPAVLFSYRKRFEKPTVTEGFGLVAKRDFIREFPKDWNGKAIFLDYDGTLRDTISGAKWPTDPSDVKILPNRQEILVSWIEKGYMLLGVSNQSGVSKNNPSHEVVRECFDKTNELLGLDIEYSYCPDNPAPVQCYCRKPMPGMAVEFCYNYKLDPRKCIMVGDRTSDKTFAKRSHIGTYVDAEEFFA